MVATAERERGRKEGKEGGERERERERETEEIKRERLNMKGIKTFSQKLVSKKINSYDAQPLFSFDLYTSTMPVTLRTGDNSGN